ncbi:MAG TPA: hypothetical protein VKH43_07280 [Thermoanaerobaculia bacterium]|nr:hypothetical protein [Thermoanaerobaculia bacterium]
MLKITRLESPGTVAVLKLEGRLVGPWVGALREIAEAELALQRPLAFEVSGVSFVDRRGEILLRELVSRQVRLDGPSGFVRELLQSNGGSR